MESNAFFTMDRILSYLSIDQNLSYIVDYYSIWFKRLEILLVVCNSLLLKCSFLSLHKVPYNWQATYFIYVCMSRAALSAVSYIRKLKYDASVYRRFKKECGSPCFNTTSVSFSIWVKREGAISINCSIWFQAWEFCFVKLMTALWDTCYVCAMH